MPDDLQSAPLGRRDVLKTGLAAGAAALLPWQTAQADLPPIPRDRTMILVWGGREGRWVDWDLWNPYSIGSNHQNGSNLIYEPLAYYSAFADKTQMWLAERYEFSPDFKRLTIKTRPGIRWSDGVPFSAEDVAYTLNSLRDLGAKVRWGIDVQQAVEKATATDANTVVVDFKIPSPRFFFFMTYKYDIGVYIVPKHVFDGQDWTTFKHFDAARRWPLTTGPWQVADASPQQKVFDRRVSWWAAESKLAPFPAVERNIWLPSAGEQQNAQAIITNQLDAGTGMQPATFPTVFRGNDKVTTHTGQKPPYGYMDWWPISLYVNNERPPFNDRDVRWALSYYIDRQQLVEVGYLGASGASIAVPGAHQANFARWKNADYDKLVDEAYAVAPDDPKKLADVWHRAMAIWLPELPDIQLVQNYHLISWNTAYWKNWPTEQNPYVNGAHWHLTFAMVLWNLQRASAA